MKWFKRIVRTIFIAPVVLYLFVLLISNWPVSVYDKDLRVERANIPVESNAFYILQTAASHVWWPEETKIGTYGHIIQQNYAYDLASDTNWNDSLAATFLANNREALADLDAAMKLPDMQVPEFKLTDKLPYLADWSRLSDVAAVRGNALFHAGREKEAFDQAANLVQLGREMKSAHGYFAHLLVGTRVESRGLGQLRRWTDTTHLNPQQLQSYILQLDTIPSEADAVVDTLKGEYEIQAGFLDDFRARKPYHIEPDKFFNQDPGDTGWYRGPSHWWPVFNLGRTKSLFAKAVRELVRFAPRHYSERKDMKLYYPQAKSIFSAYLYEIGMILEGNIGGETMYYNMISGDSDLLRFKSRQDVQLQSTRITLALRAYQLKHGQLPKDLSALMPEFMDEIPLDDFDGQPMRYAPDRKLIYSVGENLRDDNGDAAGKLDYVFTFKF